jgi:transcription elongation factor Elf1
MPCPRCGAMMSSWQYNSYPPTYSCSVCAARVEFKHTLSNTTAPFVPKEVHHYPPRVVVPQAFQDAFQEVLEP